MIKIGVWKKITLLAIVIFGLLGFSSAGVAIVNNINVNNNRHLVNASSDGWYMDSMKQVSIWTASGLVSARNYISQSEDIFYVKLSNDIDMAGVEDFMPFGFIDGSGGRCTGINAFKGTFDGCGHTIRNLTINHNQTTASAYAINSTPLGLFCWLSGTVSDLRIENMTINSEYHYDSDKAFDTVGPRGAIAGRLDYGSDSDDYHGTIQNCIVDGFTVTETGNTSNKKSTASGFVGIADGGTITNVYLDNFRTSLSGYVLVDDGEGAVTIDGAVVKADSGTTYKDDYSNQFYANSNSKDNIYNKKESATSAFEEDSNWYVPPTDDYNDGWPILLGNMDLLPIIIYNIDTNGDVGDFDEYGEADGYEIQIEIPFIHYFEGYDRYDNYEYEILEVQPTKNGSGTWSFYGEEIDVAVDGEFQGWTRTTPVELTYNGNYPLDDLYQHVFWGSGWHNEYYKATITVPKYTITYNGVNNSVLKNPTEYDINTETFELKNPTPATGYTFDGWTGGCTGDFVTNSKKVTIEKGSTGNRLYAAKFTPITYTITYNLDGGTNSTTNPRTYTIESDTFTLTAPTKSGYEFTGWTGSNGETQQKTVTITKGSTGNKTYTAHWKSVYYSITYNLNGGENHPDNPIRYSTYQSYTLKYPTKEGFDFVGWSGTGLTSIVKDVTIPVGSSEDRRYTAYWEYAKIPIRFHSVLFDDEAEVLPINIKDGDPYLIKQWASNLSFNIVCLNNKISVGSSDTDMYEEVYDFTKLDQLLFNKYYLCDISMVIGPDVLKFSNEISCEQLSKSLGISISTLQKRGIDIIVNFDIKQYGTQFN